MEYDSLEKEAEEIVNIIKKFTFNKYFKKDICILARNERRIIEIKKAINNSYLNIDEKDKINILTIHKAKGLEFKIIFIVGLEKDEFPSKKLETLNEYLEEKRLFYVAITRAKKALFFSKVNFDKNRKYLPESIFYKKIKKCYKKINVAH